MERPCDQKKGFRSSDSILTSNFELSTKFLFSPWPMSIMRVSLQFPQSSWQFKIHKNRKSQNHVSIARETQFCFTVSIHSLAGKVIFPPFTFSFRSDSLHLPALNKSIFFHTLKSHTHPIFPKFTFLSRVIHFPSHIEATKNWSTSHGE